VHGLKLVERIVIRDSRGYLERLYCASELESILDHRQILQITHSMTAERGTVRGMHFQKPPSADLKFVTCLKGEIFDVAVDLRPESKTFLRWHSEILNDANRKSLVIPPGFAHGFQALQPCSEVLYFHTAQHNPALDAGVNALDRQLGIRWPLPVVNLSDRDAAFSNAADLPGIAW
jgi:dTDP-4-dehydrorhamnose 3,5-epimerase